MAISDYSTTAASNTSISGTSIAEGCAPGNINDAIRQLMADIATGYANGSIVADGQIAAAKLATDAVETLKIKDANVTAAKLASNAVETLKIKDANVTGAKLAANTVALSNIARSGASGQVLTSNGAGSDASFQDIPAPTIISGSGTFTPAIASSGGGAATYSLQTGNYAVINDKVVVFDLIVTLASKGTLAAGNVTITGLPVAPANDVCPTSWMNNVSSGIANYSAYFVASGTVINLYKFASGAQSLLTVADLNATSSFRISGAYLK